MAESFAKCCYVCGRWGNRAFVWDSEAEMHRCSNDRACLKRKEEVVVA